MLVVDGHDEHEFESESESGARVADVAQLIASSSHTYEKRSRKPCVASIMLSNSMVIADRRLTINLLI